MQLVEAALKKAGIKPPPLPEAAPGRFIIGPGGTPQAMMMGLSTPQRFHLEARDDGWAAAVEKQLVPLIERRAAVLGVQVQPVLRQARPRQRRPRKRGRVVGGLGQRVLRGCSQPVAQSAAHLQLTRMT